MKSVYENLYDIVKNRVTENGCEMPCSKDIFLFTANKGKNVCDGRDLEELSKMDFMAAIYISMLNRVPDPGAIEYWEARKNQHFMLFANSVLRNLLTSGEVLTNNTHYMNDFLDNKKKRELNIFNVYIAEHDETENVDVGLIRKLFYKLPDKTQSDIKRMLRRD